LVGANTKNLSNSSASLTLIILKTCIIIASWSPILLVHSLSTYLHCLFVEVRIGVDVIPVLMFNYIYIFVALLYSISNFPMCVCIHLI